MIKKDGGKFTYYAFDHLSSCGSVLHFVSSGEKNIGFQYGWTPESVLVNRLELSDGVGFDLKRLVVGHQVHGSVVTVVGNEEAGRGGCDDESRIPDTDALVTDRENICLMVLTADCVPVLFFDPVRRVVAAAHAGWRGTIAGIAEKTVRLMTERFGCRASDILAGIGPSIGTCCFEVGGEVAEAFYPSYKDMVYPGKSAGKYNIDLGGTNRRQLLDAGLDAGHIELSGLCTVCRHDDFFSYRHAGTSAGRFGSGIMLSAKM